MTALLKRHGLTEASIAAYRERVEGLQSQGEGLVDGGHFDSEAISQRCEALVNRYGKSVQYLLITVVNHHSTISPSLFHQFSLLCFSLLLPLSLLLSFFSLSSSLSFLPFIRYGELSGPAQDRRALLEASLRLQELLRDIRDTEVWLAEREPRGVSTDYGTDLPCKYK